MAEFKPVSDEVFEKWMGMPRAEYAQIRSKSLAEQMEWEKADEARYARLHVSRPSLLLRERPARFASRPLRPVSREDMERGTIPGCEDKPHKSGEPMILVRNAGHGVERDIYIPSTHALRKLNDLLGKYDERNSLDDSNSIRPRHTSHYHWLSESDKRYIATLRGPFREAAIQNGRIDRFDDIFPQIMQARSVDMDSHHRVKRWGPYPDSDFPNRTLFEAHINFLKWQSLNYRDLSDQLAQFQKENPDYHPVVVRGRDDNIETQYRQQHGMTQRDLWPDGVERYPWGKVWKEFPDTLSLRANELDSEIAELQGLTPVQMLNQITGKQYSLEPEPEHDLGR